MRTVTSFQAYVVELRLEWRLARRLRDVPTLQAAQHDTEGLR